MDEYRDEILRRTKNGESGKIIAQSLRGRGFQVSDKTINRWKLQWGVRKRPLSATVGNKYPNRRSADSRAVARGAEISVIDDNEACRARSQAERKAEITARTLRGESPEAILEALEAQGFVFKKGASTIWRLQTLWGLIPFDPKRSAARLKKGRPASASAGSVQEAPSPAPAVGPPPKPVTLPPQQRPAVHYPSNCVHGPKPHSAGEVNNRSSTAHLLLRPSPDADPSTTPPSQSAQAGPSKTNTPPPGDAAADLMSAELLADLASSTLACANHLRDLCKARLEQRSVRDVAVNEVSPTDADIANAKKKVCEAAAVMRELAMGDRDAGD